jgi:hypothetical protein
MPEPINRHPNTYSHNPRLPDRLTLDTLSRGNQASAARHLFYIARNSVNVPFLDGFGTLYAPTVINLGPVWKIDHETGNLSQWDGTTVSGTNASITASTSANKNGTHGLRATINNTAADSSDQARSNKAYTTNASGLHYVQFWMRLTGHTTFGYAAATAKGVLRFGNDTVNGSTDVTARAAGLVFVGVNTLQLAIRSRNGTDSLIGSSFTLADNTWYKMRVLIDRTGANPICTWWSSTDGITFTERAGVCQEWDGDRPAAAFSRRCSVPKLNVVNVHHCVITLE